MVECLTRDRRAAGSSLTGVTALWSLSMNINPSLVLVQPRKTRPFITERLLMGRKESNQTNKFFIANYLCGLVITLTSTTAYQPKFIALPRIKTHVYIPEPYLQSLSCKCQGSSCLSYEISKDKPIFTTAYIWKC